MDSILFSAISLGLLGWLNVNPFSTNDMDGISRKSTYLLSLRLPIMPRLKPEPHLGCIFKKVSVLAKDAAFLIR